MPNIQASFDTDFKPKTRSVNHPFMSTARSTTVMTVVLDFAGPAAQRQYECATDQC